MWSGGTALLFLKSGIIWGKYLASHSGPVFPWGKRRRYRVKRTLGERGDLDTLETIKITCRIDTAIFF